MMPVSFTNQLYGDEDAKRRARVDARFVNNAMMATLMGAAISDGLEDGQVVSGVGGQYNFVAQAFALEGARSILALEATRQAGAKRNPTSAGITATRPFRGICATSSSPNTALPTSGENPTPRPSRRCWRSRTPAFRMNWRSIAKDAGKLPKDFEIPRSHRENFPERIAQALKPAREAGLLPSFPFGSDFTEVEQRLIPALAVAAGSAADAAAVARIAVAGD